jgi:RES domain-containing protein
VAVDPTQLRKVTLRGLRGTGWRHLSPGYDPLSGEAARLHGGRFNPPGSFPVLYLCEIRACAVAELRRLGERQAIGMAGLLPRVLWRYEVDLEGVLDLADPDRRDELGLGFDVLVGPEWTSCQRIGAAAYEAGVCALRTPSATGVGIVLALFLPHVGPDRVKAHLAEEWSSPPDP